MRLLFLDVGLLIHRVLLGGMMFLYHGQGKLGNLFAGEWWPAEHSRIGLPGNVEFFLIAMAEGIGSLLIVLGVGTRFFAFALVFGMLVAAFVAHADDPTPAQQVRGIYAAEHLNEDGLEVLRRQAEDEDRGELARNLIAAVERAQQLDPEVDEQAYRAAVRDSELPRRTATKELPMLFAVGFLVLVFAGGGRFAVDRLLWPIVRRYRRKRQEEKKVERKLQKKRDKQEVKDQKKAEQKKKK